MRHLLVLFALVLAAGTVAPARDPSRFSLLPPPVQPGFTPNTGARLANSGAWLDSAGRTVNLATLLDSNLPVFVYPGYSRCTMLCGPGMEGVAAAFREAGLEPGRDFVWIFMSVDPTETAADAERSRSLFLNELELTDDPGPAVTFLHSRDKAAIDALCASLGIECVPIADSGEYAHPAVMAVMERGQIAAYLSTLSVQPGEVAAAAGKAGAIPESEPAAILGCAHYDPTTGRYSLIIQRGLQVSGVALLGGLVFFALRQRRAGGRA